MERVFNSHNCKINTLLKSVKLEHLHAKMVQKCVTLDTFLNLTEEDLDYLEINDPQDRHVILNNFHLYQQHFDDIINPPEFNRTKMLMTSIQQLKAINSLASTMLNQVTIQEATQTCKNRLIDDITPVSKVINLFTAQALSSIDLIESDLTQEIRRLEGNNSKLIRSKVIPAVLLVGSLTLAIVLSCSHFRLLTPSSN